MLLKQKEAYGLHPAPNFISGFVFTASVMKNTAYDIPRDVATMVGCITASDQTEVFSDLIICDTHLIKVKNVILIGVCFQ